MILGLKYFVIVYILFSVVYFLSGKNHNKVLKLILILTAINLILSDVLVRYNIPIKFNNNVYLTLNSVLWLLIIGKEFNKQMGCFMLSLFFIITITTYWHSNIFKAFNKLGFVLNSLMYVVLFIVVSYKNLIYDNVEFFKETKYILLFSPVPFFLGMSLLWGFKTNFFSEYKLIENLTLYNFINFIVNIIFYSLINLYVYKKRKVKWIT